MVRWLGCLVGVAAVVVVAACTGGGATPTTTTTSTTSTTTTTTQPPTTTTREHEAITALRRYFDVYAQAVQADDWELLLPHIDTDNPSAVDAARRSIEIDVAAGISGERELVDIYLEFDEIGDQGLPIAAVRVWYAKENESRVQSFGMIEKEGRWLLTAVSDEPFG